MSTYSPSLRIELITTGTAAGTWGTTTNDNLSTVIDASIAGAISVTTAASSQALTYLNGPTSTSSANQAIRAILTLNTSTGADFAVYAPPVSKQYTIYNASSYVATIYNSTVAGNTTAAGTGIAIPSGKTMTVWSDGANFAQQNTSLASPSLTGVPVAPTAAFGTNTTQLATTAFVQAALQLLYPVGSIFSSTSSTNPGTSFGFGTWVAYGAGRVLIGNGGGYTAGSTGGSADAIVVSHTHTASSSFTGTAGNTGNQSADHTHSVSATTSTESASHQHAISISDPGHAHTVLSDDNYQLGTQPGGSVTARQISNGDLGTKLNFYRAASNTTGITASSGSQNANHTHSFSTTSGTVSANHSHAFTPAGSVSTTVTSAGSSGTGANLPPYVVVYMWNRTA